MVVTMPHGRIPLAVTLLVPTNMDKMALFFAHPSTYWNSK